MVNVAELLELRFGNPTKPPSSEDQGMAGADLIDEVRVPVELRNEVQVEEVLNPNVVEGLYGKDGLSTSVEGGFVMVDGEERVSEEVGGFKQIGNDLNEINLVVDLSGNCEAVGLGGFEQTGNELNDMNLVVDLSRVSEEVGVFERTGNGLNGINLVVDLSPREGLDGKLSYGNGGSEVCSGGLVVSVSDGLGNNFGQNLLITEGNCWEEHMGKDCGTEIEGNYEVTDLVWGKVRSHPWWPGQIFDPNTASEKARKHFKNDHFLIAYFGDQTYAWNNASQIKPFRKHFSQMVKQSNTEAFRFAVDCALLEVSRRVEFGLACSCLSEDMFVKIKSQVVVNVGISEESRIRVGGDRFSSVVSFEPTKVVENVKALAVDPLGETSKLEFVKARAQLSAYHRWKGYYQLPAQTLLNGLMDNADNEPDSVAAYGSDEEVNYGKNKSTTRNSNSRKRKHISTDGVTSNKKTKRLSELTYDSCLNIQNNKSVKTGRKRKVADSLSDLRDESGTADKKSSTSPPKKTYRVGENLCRIARKLSGSALSLKNGDRSSQNSVSRISRKSTRVCHAKESGGVEVPAAYPRSDEILSQLYLTAIDPMKENSSLTSLVRFFIDFRSYSVEISNNKSPGEIVSGVTVRCSPNSGTKEVSGIDGIEDSYWTDRIIQNNPEEQLIFEPEVANLELNAEKPAGRLDNKCEEYSGTALILNFDKKVSVPSVTNLNNIYNQVGPLKEVSTKNKRAKVVFERQCDAETAFSSAGKYSIFGPSLLNYSIDYSPTPRKITTRARKKTEEKDATPMKAQ